MKKIAAIIGMAVVMTGCATQTALIHGGGQATPSLSESQAFFVGGIGQERTINAAQVCGGASNVAKVQSKLEPKDILLGTITLGIYTPRTAQVYCK